MNFVTLRIPSKKLTRNNLSNLEIGATPKPGATVRAAMWWQEHRLPLAQQLGPILLTAAGIWISYWIPGALLEAESRQKSYASAAVYWISQAPIWLFLISAGISIYGGWAGHRESKQQSHENKRLNSILYAQRNMANDLEEAQLAADYLQVKIQENLFAITSEYLGHISSDHLLLTDKERVSLYISHNSAFRLVGRHSLNSEYMSIGRSEISESEGCIGDVWKNGGDGIRELPDDFQERLEELKSKYSMNIGVAKNLRMPSVSYACISLSEGFTRIGMVVVESARKGVLEYDEIHKTALLHREFMLQCLRRSRKEIELEEERTAGEAYV